LQLSEDKQKLKTFASNISTRKEKLNQKVGKVEEKEKKSMNKNIEDS
jgi:hypothetical protein